MNARLLSLETAVPGHRLDTSDVVREASAIFGGRHPDFERLLPIYANSGVRSRYSVMDYDWFRAPQGWPERSAAFVDGACAMFRSCADAALAGAGVEAGAIDTIVTISSTGVATPTIEARVLHDMGFRDDVKRVPVFGLGCAGGVSGLSLAARLAAAQPRSLVLLVVIELCTVTFRADELSKSNIVGTALFGDGAAAAVLSTAGAGLGAIEHMGEHTWADTTDIMGWRVDPQGFGVIFSRSIPDLATSDLRPAADGFLARHELQLADIDAYSFHPGGAKVVTALETAFGLPEGHLADERQVLADFGNMSAPTVLFVLKRAVERGERGRRFVSSLGPGFTASFLTMLQ